MISAVLRRLLIVLQNTIIRKSWIPGTMRIRGQNRVGRLQILAPDLLQQIDGANVPEPGIGAKPEQSVVRFFLRSGTRKGVSEASSAWMNEQAQREKPATSISNNRSHFIQTIAFYLEQATNRARQYCTLNNTRVHCLIFMAHF